MRSTLKPGPYEGQRVLDVDGEDIGVVEALEVQGTHVTGLRVTLDDGGPRIVPRDWFAETDREGLVLARRGDDVRALDAPR